MSVKITTKRFTAFSTRHTLLTEKRLFYKMKLAKEKQFPHKMNKKHTIFKKKQNKRRKLRGTSSAPLLMILLYIGIAAVGIVLFILFVPGWAKKITALAPDLSCLGYEAPEAEAERALPTPSPTPDPAANHSVYTADLTQVQHEILLNEYQFLSDVRCSGADVWCAVGSYSSKTGLAELTAAACIHPDEGTKEYIPASIRYNSMRFPMGNENWVVFADVQNAGGGRICCINRQTGEQKEIKTVHIGVPVLQLYGSTAFWMERTGTHTFKLFGCDLETGESVTVDTVNEQGAVSRTYLWNDILYYTGSEGQLLSYCVTTGEKSTVLSSYRVHDAKTNGTITAFLTGYHDYDSKLCYFGADGTVHIAAEGATDFFLGDTFIAYADMQKCYVYFPEDGVTFCLTRSGEKAMLAAAGGDRLYWLDVSWHDKDVLEFMHVSNMEQ